MFEQCRRGLAAACVLASAGALAVVSMPRGAATPDPLLRLAANGAPSAAHGEGFAPLAGKTPASKAPAGKTPGRAAAARADRGMFRPNLPTLSIPTLGAPADRSPSALAQLEPRQAMPESPPTLQEAVADLQRREAQAAAAAAQAKKQAAEAAAAQAEQRKLAKLHRWVRPNGGSLSSPFGIRWGRMHEGIDLAGGYGSPILAATAGRVIYAGPESGYGRIVKILDWDGTQTWYGHMAQFLVHAGDTVVPGQPIALVGAAGDATGPHLHFEVHVGGAVVDPVPFLAARGVRI